MTREVYKIYLPLYSTRFRYVPEKSGLNQWNAYGRPRNFDEVYIPIPIAIHKNFPCFFPDRDTHFALILPSDEILIAKVCQDNCKALMSFPNSDLGKWILREVFNMQEGELIEYNNLLEYKIDSVCVTKLNLDDRNLINKYDEELKNIYHNKKHSIFHNPTITYEEIKYIFNNIFNNKLYYRINIAKFNAYEQQFNK